MPWLYLIAFLAGLATTVTVVPFVIVLARRFGATDHPDGGRKAHLGATPRWGGLAIAAGLLVSLSVLTSVTESPFDATGSAFPAGSLVTLVGLGLVIGIGLVDDLRDLAPAAKLIGQSVAAALFFVDGFRIERLDFLGAHVDFGPLALPATCLWLVGCMNAWNLIDGVDGLAAGVGTIVALTMAAAAALLGHPGVALVGVAFAGSLSGFLVHNSHPARIFMGDTGSLLVGAVLGLLAIRGSLVGAGTIAIGLPVLAMGLPIIDTVAAIVRRWFREVPWHSADRHHLHHRLLADGWENVRTVLFLYAITAVFCGAGLASLFVPSLAAPLALVATGALLVVCFRRVEQRHALLAGCDERLRRGDSDRRIARCAWEATQQLCHDRSHRQAARTARSLAAALDCVEFRLRYLRGGARLIDLREAFPVTHSDLDRSSRGLVRLRLTHGEWPGELLSLEYRQHRSARLSLAAGGRLLDRFGAELLHRLRVLAAEDATPLRERIVNPPPSRQRELGAGRDDSAHPIPADDRLRTDLPRHDAPTTPRPTPVHVRGAAS